MSRPPRTPGSDGAFDDPLNDYREQSYSDPLERALHDEQVTQLWSKQVACVGPDATIEEAMRRMSILGVTCVFIVENEKLLGVFSERDVLSRVAHRYHELKGEPVRQVMSQDPVVLWESDKAGTALGAVGVGRARHVPVLDLNGRVLGVASPWCIVAFLRAHCADPFRLDIKK